jgi:hypothetical protein
LLEFPELEEKKVVKKISEDVSIDYYFLENKKVMELLKNSRRTPSAKLGFI